MTFRPLFGIDSSGKSEAEQNKETDSVILNNMILLQLGSIFCELQLMNARIEEAFETHIAAGDV